MFPLRDRLIITSSWLSMFLIRIAESSFKDFNVNDGNDNYYFTADLVWVIDEPI